METLLLCGRPTGVRGPNVARIDATHCMDMIAGEEERERIAQEGAEHQHDSMPADRRRGLQRTLTLMDA